MDNLNYQLMLLTKRNREGSYSTQQNRHRILQLCASQLRTMGFKGMKANSLKPKHIESLIDRWKVDGISTGTVKNRMAILRWWAEKIDKPGVVKRENREYEIDRRRYVTNLSKGKDLPRTSLSLISNKLVQLSLRLQEQFGLRREEAIKFNVGFAYQDDHILLKSSWTKGGRERVIPIRTPEQVSLLNEIKKTVGNQSLIPAQKTFKQQLKTYEWHTSRAGLNKMHGLRHAYAQQRYQEITGWKAPALGGPKLNELTNSQREIDHGARCIISSELGHNREQVTAVYLGR